MSSSRVPFRVAVLFVGAALTVAAPWIAVARAQACQPCPGPCDVPDAADCVCETYGAAVYTHPESCGVLAFYGKPMSSGTDPGLAAQAWIDNHAGAFDLSPTDLQLVRTNRVSGWLGLCTAAESTRGSTNTWAPLRSALPAMRAEPLRWISAPGRRFCVIPTWARLLGTAAAR